MKIKRFLKQYATFNLVCALCFSIPILFVKKTIFFLLYGLFGVVFIKINIVYQLFQFDYLSLCSLGYISLLVSFVGGFNHIDNNRLLSKQESRDNYLRIVIKMIIFSILVCIEALITGWSGW